MGLEDFEKELAASKSKGDKKKRERSRSRDRHHRSSKHHSSRHNRDDRDRDGHHRDKRSRNHRETSEERSRRKRREREHNNKDDDQSRRKHKDRRSRSPSSEDEDRLTRKHNSRRYEEDESFGDDVSREKDYMPHDDELLDEQLEEAASANVQRDDWMQAPSSMDVDYVQRRKREEKTTYVAASAEKQHALKIHKAELNHHLADLKEETTTSQDPAQREVDYMFGDSGSQWRMTKLKGIYRAAEETGRTVEDVALEKYGDLRDFDEAREEATELDRRTMYGDDYVGKEKPSGELYEERRLDAGLHRSSRKDHEKEDLPQGESVSNPRPTTTTVALSRTELNKLKAQMMKAKMKKSPDAARLEAEYNAAIAGSSGSTDRDVVVLNAMDNRMLAGGRQGEVISLENKRGVERGLVKENEHMSIEDMVRQERRTKGQNEGLILAEKIGKDAKFDVSLQIF